MSEQPPDIPEASDPAPEPSLPQLVVPPASSAPEPAKRAWPLALLLAVFNFVFGTILISVSGRVGPILGLAPIAIEMILGLFLSNRSPRASRILLLAPLLMLAILAGLFVIVWGICNTMGNSESAPCPTPDLMASASPGMACSCCSG
ncbi:MAG TPA: hypothetical protein VGS22_09280 [Thermoanaerobaculia bacterium]|jgi:hypothetical protein|nr:hypothetical protein [Thermoanaerobaculia bacterium]